MRGPKKTAILSFNDFEKSFFDMFLHALSIPLCKCKIAYLLKSEICVSQLFDIITLTIINYLNTLLPHYISNVRPLGLC